ncbi:MAG: hypothetical protein AB1668_05860, partial [Nanoarchaeota archaeon]
MIGKKGELATLVVIGVLILAGGLFVLKNIGNGITGAAVIEIQAAGIPEVTINLPVNNSNFSTQLQDLNVTVVEPGGNTTNRVTFNITNGSNPSFNISASNTGFIDDNYWNYSNFNMSYVAEGEHLIIVYATNTQGDLNDTENITIHIDRTAPVVYIVTANNTNTTNTVPSVLFNFTENLFQTAVCTFYANNEYEMNNVSTR